MVLVRFLRKVIERVKDRKQPKVLDQVADDIYICKRLDETA